MRHITWFLDDSHSILGFCFQVDFAGVGGKDAAPFFVFFGVAAASFFVFFGVACVIAEGKSEDVARVVASEASLVLLPPFCHTFFFFFTTCSSPHVAVCAIAS